MDSFKQYVEISYNPFEKFAATKSDPGAYYALGAAAGLPQAVASGATAAARSYRQSITGNPYTANDFEPAKDYILDYLSDNPQLRAAVLHKLGEVKSNFGKSISSYGDLPAVKMKSPTTASNIWALPKAVLSGAWTSAINTLHTLDIFRLIHGPSSDAKEFKDNYVKVIKSLTAMNPEVAMGKLEELMWLLGRAAKGQWADQDARVSTRT